MLEDLTTINTILIDGSTLVLVALSFALTGRLLAPMTERLKLAMRTRRVPVTPASQ